MTEAPPRILPVLSRENQEFWTGGAEGELRIARCQDCGYYIHPPAPICAKCYGRNMKPEAVSGRATVATFTINQQKWLPDLTVPYAIAIVELEEQKQLRLTTNIVNCPLDEIEIGMKVRVVFEQQEDIFLPLFEPA